jgi:hypothetical protein
MRRPDWQDGTTERAPSLFFNKPCYLCVKHGGSGRYDSPHAGLALRDGDRDRLACRVSDNEYRCSFCGLDWFKDTGSTGTGWVSFPSVFTAK